MERITNARMINFDDISGDLLGRDYSEWSEAGADCNDWNLSPIIKNIHKLLLDPLDYIILDYPFGKAHRDVGAYIDYCVWVDIPLDISLARRILRDFTRRNPARRPLSGEVSQEISSYLDWYLARHRNSYFMHINTIKPSADLIVDGERSIDVIASEILQRIKH